tara:strand:+ start:1515 stop:1718 length:204 start_codon:yes stop_codon:yes gene_type:complete
MRLRILGMSDWLKLQVVPQLRASIPCIMKTPARLVQLAQLLAGAFLVVRVAHRNRIRSAAEVLTLYF